MKHSFFAYIFRMRYIARWALMRNTRVENVEEDKARELIRKTDKQRRSYYNFFADGNWGLRSNYDLMLSTDGHSPEEIADLIIAFAGVKAE